MSTIIPRNSFYLCFLKLIAYQIGLLCINSWLLSSAIAQAQNQIPNVSPNQILNKPQIVTPSKSPSLPENLQQLPSPNDLLKPSNQPSSNPKDQINVAGKIVVQRFDVAGSTVFSDEERKLFSPMLSDQLLLLNSYRLVPQFLICILIRVTSHQELLFHRRISMEGW